MCGKEAPMRGHSRAIATSVLAVLAVGMVAGCGAAPGKQSTTAATGGPGATTSSAPATHCGMVRTAAGVPVDVEIVGRATCRAAMTVERDYTKAIASGKVPGNGGGAPVTIKGWICQGFNTPEVLATGRASACKRHGSQILAVLPSPSPSPS
jgi:hypothetical protein